MSALAKQMPQEEVVPVCKKADLPRQKKVLKDQHKDNLNAAVNAFPNANMDQLPPLHAELGFDVMEDIDVSWDVVGKY